MECPYFDEKMEPYELGKIFKVPGTFNNWESKCAMYYLRAAQEITLSKIGNNLTAIIRREKSFTNRIQNIVNHAQVIEGDYEMSFVDACVLSIVDDMMLPKSLAANSKSTYARFIRFTRVMIKKEGALPILTSFSKDAPLVKTLGITNLDDPGLFIPTEEDILLMI